MFERHPVEQLYKVLCHKNADSMDFYRIERADHLGQPFADLYKIVLLNQHIDLYHSDVVLSMIVSGQLIRPATATNKYFEILMFLIHH